MRLCWDGSTCAQTSLKCISFRPVPTLLPQTHGPLCSKRDQSPTTQKGPPQNQNQTHLHMDTPTETERALLRTCGYALLLRSRLEWVLVLMEEIRVFGSTGMNLCGSVLVAKKVFVDPCLWPSFIHGGDNVFKNGEREREFSDGLKGS